MVKIDNENQKVLISFDPTKVADAEFGAYPAKKTVKKMVRTVL